ncbi:UNC-like C-terminal-domain-containing protein [Blakeslea trispora]|nr:UNC-like C-terminal-domain-containing protein [Blakeslea trispora]
MLCFLYLLQCVFYLLIPTLLLAKPTPKQCPAYSTYDATFSDTCLAHAPNPVDFSAALFPDPFIISDISHYEEQRVSSTVTKPSDPTTTLTQHKTHTKKETKEKRPLVSFEEWQQKIQLDKDNKDCRIKRKPGPMDDSPANKRQQMVESIDGGFSDDFGSMLEDLIGGVVAKEKKPNVYAEGEYISPSKGPDQKKHFFADARIKSLKERFNYASTDCAATVRKANKQAKGAQSILYESKDQYLLNKCSADKFVIINLCEQIVVDTIVMANFEFFSSTFKDFRVYASSKYPTDDWRLLGQWQARNTRDLQVFKVPDSGFVEYVKIEFLTHYGHEYYCPLSLVRVHGMTMMEYYTTVESQDEGPAQLGEEHLWPAEVREQIIQPQFNITNTSESFPIKHDIEEDIKPMIPPMHVPDLEVTSHVVASKDATSMTETSVLPVTQTEPLPSISVAIPLSVSTSIYSDIYSTSLPSSLQDNTLTMPSNTTQETNGSMPVLIIANSTNQTQETYAIQTATLATSSSPPKITPKDNGNTQESIYKTIMKRLNILEVNMTLSQRFLDDQNKILNDVFLDMEKRHQEQLMMLIGHLNETASYKIESMKRRYEQWYEDLKEQTSSDMQDMTAKISMLSDQLSYERRMSVTQLIIMIILFVFMALSRGTFNILSPVVAAQQEQRNRRQSIGRESLDAMLRQLRPIKKPVAPSTTINTVIETVPKKPKNPRRHSDSPYHTMPLDNHSSSQITGPENEALHLKLDQAFLQQEAREQTVPLIDMSENMIKNRKRSSTSPTS